LHQTAQKSERAEGLKSATAFINQTAVIQVMVNGDFSDLRGRLSLSFSGKSETKFAKKFRIFYGLARMSLKIGLERAATCYFNSGKLSRIPRLLEFSVFARQGGLVADGYFLR